MPTSSFLPSVRPRRLNVLPMEAGRLPSEKDGTVPVGPNLETSHEGVFAAGDLALGPATVIEAVAQGNKVAVAVDAYLKGQPVERPKFTTEFREIPQLYNIENYAEAKRPVLRELPTDERIRNFEEVEGGFDEQKTREECKRCLRCDLEWLESMGSEQRDQESCLDISLRCPDMKAVLF